MLESFNNQLFSTHYILPYHTLGTITFIQDHPQLLQTEGTTVQELQTTCSMATCMLVTLPVADVVSSVYHYFHCVVFGR